MNCDITTRNELINKIEKKGLIDREAYRAFGKVSIGTSIDIDDFRQEARLAVNDAIDYFPEDRDIKYFDSYAVRSMQNRLCNFLYYVHRRILVPVADECMVTNLIDDFQSALPTLDDIEILYELSFDAKAFLECVVNPPKRLKEKIIAKYTSGKPHCKNVMSVVLEWFGFDSTKALNIICELREKCIYFS